MSKPSPDDLYAMRHSLAHIMATAIQELYPDAKFGVGPVVEDGFYYDVDLEQTLSPEDLRQIEKKMHEVVKADYPFEHSSKKLDEAIKYFKDKKQPYKVELLNDLKQHGTTVAKEIDRDQLGVDPGKEVTEVGFYTDGPFTDLCRGPHVESTGKVGAFKLMRVSGAYWRGSEKNPQLQRVYGVGFADKEELESYLTRLEEAEKRDHKKLGPALDLFFFHETSPGMPYWLPAGVVMYNQLIDFWRSEHYARGYEEIVSPLVNKKALYQTSGHYDHYWDNMFTSEPEEGDEYALKAMNCPNAMLVFKNKLRSYRELPLRFGDTDTLHRYEMSGALNGLLRVREFRQDDAHIFVTEEQVKEEYGRIFEIVERFYSVFGLEYKFRLGTRPDDFMGDPKLWDKAEQELKEILEESGREYFVLEGDGAFYGPKIDIVMKDALGRDWQMGTIQLDFQQPRRFELAYADRDGSEKVPVVIHRVIYGSMERFIGILIEHYAGAFPAWLSYEPVRLVTVNDDEKVVARAQEMAKQLRGAGIRNGLDLTNESVGKKIREAGLAKVPYTIVVGEKEATSNKVSPRLRQGHGEEPGEISFETFMDGLKREISERHERSVF